ncbi:MAG: AraC family transcriptional regulator ligand-binding domain-containing protein [Pseudomonadales bacterium]|nr:AraC family transcriptional regulator ligand-binding domain-containing protein [Pseudomonadales bacterium]
MSSCFVASDPVLPATLLPATVLDAALGRGHEPQRLLAGTRLFPEDLLSSERALSTAQFVRMLANLERQDGGRDTFFRLGALAMPAAFGPLAPLFASARTANDALRALLVYRRLCLPFLHLRTIRCDDACWLLLDDAGGAAGVWRPVAETVGALLVELFRSLDGARPEATWVFTHREPAHVEQYHETFGLRIVFDAPVTAVRFPRAWLERPLPGRSEVRWRIARRACATARAGTDPGPGFVEAVRTHLLRCPRREAALVPCAERFAMSPATFKRRLREHGVRFQALADRVALERTLEMLLLRGLAPDDAIRMLGYSDPSNFRRAFKRWTGRRPLELVAQARRALEPHGA